MRCRCPCAISKNTVRPRRNDSDCGAGRWLWPITNGAGRRRSACSMSHEKLTYEDLLQIIELVKSSEQWSEFHLKVGDLEVDFKRAPRSSTGASSAAAAAAATDSHAATSAAAGHQRAGHVGGGEVVNDLPSATASQTAPHAAPVDHSANAVLVKSPMVGTF